MDKAELVLDYLDVLVWPIVVVVIVFVFRGRLRELLGRVTEFGGPGVNAKFAHATEQAERLAESGTGTIREKLNRPKSSHATKSPETSHPTKSDISEAKRRKPYLRMTVPDFGALDKVVAAFEKYDVVVVGLTTCRTRTGTWRSTFWRVLLGVRTVISRRNRGSVRRSALSITPSAPTSTTTIRRGETFVPPGRRVRTNRRSSSGVRRVASLNELALTLGERLVEGLDLPRL